MRGFQTVSQLVDRISGPTHRKYSFLFGIVPVHKTNNQEMNAMELTGKSIIGYQRPGGGGELAYAMNPATGEKLLPGYAPARPDEVDRAAKLAHDAFAIYGRWSGSEKAIFLRRIASNIEALGDPLTTRAVQETGLPPGRIQSE